MHLKPEDKKEKTAIEAKIREIIMMKTNDNNIKPHVITKYQRAAASIVE